MAVASWMISSRITGRSNRGKLNVDEDLYKLDKNKTPKQNTCDILRGICSRSSIYYDIFTVKTSNNGSPTEANNTKNVTKTIISDARRLSYLNALVKLLSNEETRQLLGFTSEELLCCLRVSLVHESTQVRAGTLRVIRYVLRATADVVVFNSLRLPYLVARCMDVVLKNEMERIQALKVIRRIMRIEAHLLEDALARVLLAVPAAAPEDKDRLMRACLAALCELGVLNPTLFIETGCVAAITRAILDCQTPRIAESLCGVLLHLLNHPSTREPARVDLKCLAAPYCDFHYRHGWIDKNRDEREMRFTCSRLSLLSVLRSWPGLLHFCDPMNESGLRAIVDVLYLNQLEVRKAVLDLLYELLGLPQPEWTDEICVALAAVDPSDFQDSWRLSEGFVAAEGRFILPHLASTGPNIIELHLSLLLYCFYDMGLLDALVEVMVTSDTFISVRATVLLGQLLHLIHLLLPPQVCHISPALPDLLSRAAKSHPQALAALAALQSLNSLLSSRPASNSLFLDLIIQSCDTSSHPQKIVSDSSPRVPRSKSESSKGIYKYPEDSMDVLNEDDFELQRSGRLSLGSRGDYGNRNEGVLVKSKSITEKTSAVVNRVVKSKKYFNVLKENDSLIRDSNILQKEKMGYSWNWNIIRAILKEGVWGVEQAILVRRLIHYLRPSSHKFSHTDLLQAGPANTRDQAQTALHLVSYLLHLREPDATKLLEELFVDIANQIAAISRSRSAHECLFSPQHMTNTMCQLYFLFIGKLCSTKEGLVLFRETGLYESLMHLAVTTPHSCYVKLIISSLDYTINSYPRTILAQTALSKMESSRLYVVQFLNVLLRARQKACEINNKHNCSRNKNVETVDVETSNEKELDMSRSWTPDVCSDMDTWILELLVKMARDSAKAVSICALNTLEEACNIPAYLNKLVTMKPHVKDLGDKGYLLWVRFIGSVSGFQALVEAGYVRRQIRYWVEHYNYRYTRLVEGEIHDCLTLLQRAEDGRYRRRVTSGPTSSKKCAPFPVHLYAQLPRHPLGRDLLARHADLQQLIKCIKQSACNTDQEIMDLKSALWACGHTATSAPGIDLLLSYNEQDESNVFADTVHLAQTSPVYSIRGTAFYVLGLMACTYEGANLLHTLGWLCVRHDRHECWPIIQDENWLTKSASEDEIYSTLYSSSDKPTEKKILEGEISENSCKTDQTVSEECSSDNAKLSIKVGGVSTIQHSLREESCDSCEGDIEDKVDFKFNMRSVSESSDKSERRIKYQTLPQGCYHSTKKHQRSLSESKTVDKFKTEEDTNENVQDRLFQIGSSAENKYSWRHNIPDTWSEGMLRRIRNNSESSTSGVSSCDSVLGKYVYNDRILTLSPIPSSSSLSAMKNIVPNKRQSEVTRRISLHSFTGSDVASSPPSQRDLVGYAALRNLNHHRLPTHSEANADEISEFLNNDSKKVHSFGSLKGKGKHANLRNSTKMSIFKYDWKPMADKTATSFDKSSRSGYGYRVSTTSNMIEGNSRPSSVTIPRPPAQPGPIYMGISMPRNLLDIFPSSSAHLAAGNQFPDDSLLIDVTQHDLGIRKNDDSNFNSSFSDLSIGNGAKSSSRMTRHTSKERFNKHDSLSCLYCSRLKPTAEVKKTSDLREAFFAGMDSPRPAGSSSVHVSVKSPAAVNSLPCASLDISCGSPTSLESNLSKISEGNPNITADILKHSERMGNPISYKVSRQALLALKQKHPEAFQNICLYSEVCKLISQNTYRLGARRFLQELFLDLNFDILYLEPQQIIQHKLAELELESG